MKKMSTFGKGSEDAVSPVIGVILMVAITVILAAVIAAFVFGMAGNVQKTRSVAATAGLQTDKIIVTYQGGPDVDQVTALTVTSAESDGTTAIVMTPSPIAAPVVGATSVGTKTMTGRAHVVVVASFNDNTQQVILDTYI